MKVSEILINKMLAELIEACKIELELDHLPDITLVDTTDDIGYSSFGLFDGSIKVVSGNRHPMDVMRTVAHELVHWKQKVEGKVLDGSDGSSTENEANAIAGIIMRRFGKNHPYWY